MIQKYTNTLRISCEFCIFLEKLYSVYHEGYYADSENANCVEEKMQKGCFGVQL